MWAKLTKIWHVDDEGCAAGSTFVIFLYFRNRDAATDGTFVFFREIMSLALRGAGGKNGNRRVHGAELG